jgi:hypothetical protein
MLELTGMAAIVTVLVGSVLIALFAGEALITWIIRAMSAGVKRADAAAAKLAGQPQNAGKLLNGQRARLQRV